MFYTTWPGEGMSAIGELCLEVSVSILQKNVKLGRYMYCLFERREYISTAADCVDKIRG